MRGTTPVAIGVLLTVASPASPAADAPSEVVAPDRRYEHLENPEWPLRSGAGAGATGDDARRVRADQPRCALLEAGVDRSSTEGCLGCHPEAAGRNKHRVGVDYAAAAARREFLRSGEEVVARGVFLPGGSVECTTCHDGRSSAAYRLAVPARGASPSPPARPGWPRLAVPASVSGRGQDARALCVACHTVADGPPDV